VLMNTGHSSYSWSHIPGFSGGVTTQRSDFTLAFSEISRFCFVSAFEKIGPVQYIGVCARPKEKLLRELIKQF